MKTKLNILVEKLEVISGHKVLLKEIEDGDINYKLLDDLFSIEKNRSADSLPENIKEWRRFASQYIRALKYIRQITKDKDFYNAEVERLINIISPSIQRDVKTNVMEKTVVGAIINNIVLNGDPYKHSIVEVNNDLDPFDRNSEVITNLIAKGNIRMSSFQKARNKFNDFAERVVKKAIDDVKNSPSYLNDELKRLTVELNKATKSYNSTIKDVNTTIEKIKNDFPKYTPAKLHAMISDKEEMTGPATEYEWRHFQEDVNDFLSEISQAGGLSNYTISVFNILEKRKGEGQFNDDIADYFYEYVKVNFPAITDFNNGSIANYKVNVAPPYLINIIHTFSVNGVSNCLEAYEYFKEIEEKLNKVKEKLNNQ
jgi:hypothetical protein